MPDIASPGVRRAPRRPMGGARGESPTAGQKVPPRLAGSKFLAADQKIVTLKGLSLMNLVNMCSRGISSSRASARSST